MKNRIKYLDISEQIVTDILKIASENAIPKDAKIIRMVRNPNNFSFRLFIHSKKFDIVPEAGNIPKHGTPVVSSGVLK